MAITQRTLRTILATAFSLDERFVVPKEGNWYNPQNEGGPSTWVSFVKRDSVPKLFPYYGFNGNSAPVSLVLKTSEVSLQIIGDIAEELAESVTHWIQRTDIYELFKAYDAAVFVGGLGRVITSNVSQPGRNDVLAYNVGFKVQWESAIQTINEKVTSATFNGDVITGGI